MAMLLAIVGFSAAAHAQYTVVDLNPSSGYSGTMANGDGGGQVGQGGVGVISHALVWSGTAASVVDLHPSAYTGGSVANGSIAGMQVGLGAVSLGGATHALTWLGTAASAVDLNGTFSSSAAYGVASGPQVGFGTVSDPHATLWFGTAASVVDLNPAGSLGSVAYGVDGSHQVGVKLTDGVHPDHALLWSGTAASVVDLNPSGYGVSIAWGVSGSSQVGQATPTGGPSSHAMLWSGTAASFVDLNGSGYDATVAKGVAGGKQAGYGVSEATAHTHALVWSGTSSSVIDLETFLPAGLSDSKAFGIDLSGNIAGFAFSTDGTTHAVLWKPVLVPEPASFLLICIGLAALATSRRPRLTFEFPNC
jgi:PEP-CTERM motif